MKTLKGSEKQVSWASDIRRRFINDAELRISEIRADGYWSDYYKTLAEEEFSLKIEFISNLEQSKSFINNRDSDFGMLLVDIANNKNELRRRYYEIRKLMKEEAKKMQK